MDHTEPARFVNPDLSILAIAMSVGGGYIPSQGCFTAKVWAVLTGVTDTTFRNWVTKHKIPFRQPGAEMYVEAADLLRHLPYHANGSDVEPDSKE